MTVIERTTWECSNQLRRVRHKPVPHLFHWTVEFQQLWKEIDWRGLETGKTEWREIPMVDADE